MQGANEVCVGFVNLGELTLHVLISVPIGTELAFRDDILRSSQDILWNFDSNIGDNQRRKRDEVARGQRACATFGGRQRAQEACRVAAC